MSLKESNNRFAINPADQSLRDQSTSLINCIRRIDCNAIDLEEIDLTKSDWLDFVQVVRRIDCNAIDFEEIDHQGWLIAKRLIRSIDRLWLLIRRIDREAITWLF